MNIYFRLCDRQIWCKSLWSLISRTYPDFFVLSDVSFILGRNAFLTSSVNRSIDSFKILSFTKVNVGHGQEMVYS